MKPELLEHGARDAEAIARGQAAALAAAAVGGGGGAAALTAAAALRADALCTLAFCSLGSSQLDAALEAVDGALALVPAHQEALALQRQVDAAQEGRRRREEAAREARARKEEARLAKQQREQRLRAEAEAAQRKELELAEKQQKRATARAMKDQQRKEQRQALREGCGVCCVLLGGRFD
jgi:hypothetical protein